MVEFQIIGAAFVFLFFAALVSGQETSASR
jgi:hypothetical protein